MTIGPEPTIKMDLMSVRFGILRLLNYIFIAASILIITSRRKMRFQCANYYFLEVKFLYKLKKILLRAIYLKKTILQKIYKKYPSKIRTLSRL